MKEGLFILVCLQIIRGLRLVVVELDDDRSTATSAGESPVSTVSGKPPDLSAIRLLSPPSPVRSPNNRTLVANLSALRLLRRT
jgi:hypothetical protein